MRTQQRCDKLQDLSSSWVVVARIRSCRAATLLMTSHDSCTCLLLPDATHRSGKVADEGSMGDDRLGFCCV